MTENTQAGPEEFEAIIKNAIEEMDLSQDQTALANQLTEIISSGGTLDQVFDLTEEDEEVIYAMAHNYYNNGKYERAIPLFQFLSIVDHLNKKWWMGLGAATQMAKEYDKAVNAYAMATLLDVDDPRPQLQAAYCLLMMKRNPEAQQALEGAILTSGDNDEYKDLKVQAQALLASVNESQAKAG